MEFSVITTDDIPKKRRIVKFNTMLSIAAEIFFCVLAVGVKNNQPFNTTVLGHVIVVCDNNSIQSFEWPYVVPYYSSLVDIREEDI